MKLLAFVLLTIMSAFASNTASAQEDSAPFRHVVLFQFKADTPPEKIKEIEAAFAELPSKIDTIVDFEWGPSESVEGKNDGLTHCFLVTFKDKAGLETYIPHEAHKAFIAIARPAIEKAVVFDYTAR